jgi:hypothetical protein
MIVITAQRAKTTHVIAISNAFSRSRSSRAEKERDQRQREREDQSCGACNEALGSAAGRPDDV